MKTRTLVLCVAIAAALTLPAQAAAPKPGSYKGLITNQPSGSKAGDVRFKVARGKVRKFNAEFWYMCAGAYGLPIATLQYMSFPFSDRKETAKLSKRGTFKIRETIDRESGFVIVAKGRVSGGKAKGTIKLSTDTNRAGCGTPLRWTAKR